MVTAVLVEGRSTAEVARTYGISRTWVHELVARYQREGDTGLEPRSRRPHTNPAVVAVRLCGRHLAAEVRRREGIIRR